MRRQIIMGNWKMNMHRHDGEALAKQLAVSYPKANDNNKDNKNIVICPPFPLLHCVHDVIADSGVILGAQDCHYETSGAFTGDVSPAMLRDASCDYVIIGHSERRQYHRESHDLLKQKIIQAMAQGLQSVYCVGESLNDYRAGKTKDVIAAQLNEALCDINGDNITIAYEPFWAIGSGLTPKPDEVNHIHEYIRAICANLFSDDIVNNMPILYGGSLKPDNVADFAPLLHVDGALVGGASLKYHDFKAIIDAF